MRTQPGSASGRRRPSRCSRSRSPRRARRRRRGRRAVGQQQRHPRRPARRRHGRLRGRHRVRRDGAGRVRRAVPRPPELPAERGLAVLLRSSQENNKVSFDLTSAPLRDWDAKKSLDHQRGRRPGPHPGDLPRPGDAVRLRRRAAAGQRLRAVHAELPAADRGVGPRSRTSTTCEQADGKYYMLPGLYESPQPQYSIAIRAGRVGEGGDHRGPGDVGRPAGRPGDDQGRRTPASGRCPTAGRRRTTARSARR